ncbi:ATP-binding protein [Rugamonas sp. CCM 8940]|uniref:ATP-binding protein n=1 Tax=Rugamonas sp. CCM 8940 TaxID=2765359 RepID=UPI0018F3996E|nr:ATP-binding protein [Rugamonas sp. CCM 8940]MBJ7312944.1 response regulator [Rugamonas sp. CCM 8940]
MTPPLSRPPQTILIATGSAFDLAALQQLLSRYSFQVQSVSKGDSALQAVAAGGIALTLLDVALAGSAGFELCRRLTALSARPMPVFLLSATPSDDEQLRATQAGAAAYITLPLRPAELARRVLHELGVLSDTPAPPDPCLAELSVNYHAMLASSPDIVLLLDLEQNRLIDVNRNACRLFGRSEAELLQANLLDLCPRRQPDGRASAAALAAQMAQVQAGDIRMFAVTFQHRDGRLLNCEMRMVALDQAERQLMHVRVIDISSRTRAEALRQGQNALLEMIARGAPLTATLDQLIHLIEAQSDGVLCAVMLLADDGVSMQAGAGASLPPAYLHAFEGLAIGPAVGSCGTSMYRKETVVVADILNDPLWAPYRAMAGEHGLRACWSTPIIFEQDHVFGSFAMYYTEVRSPTSEERRLIDVASHLAGIAIAGTRRERELLRHREHLEELVAARTAELRLANEELSAALENLGRTRDELVRRDKLAALGTLVAGVAHELNTPIGNSLMMATSISERTAEMRAGLAAGLRRSALEGYLAQAAEADEVMVRNLRRAADLVASFKRIAVDSAGSQRCRFQLDQMLPELLSQLKAGHAGPLRLELDIEAGLELDSYPGPLEQAVANLFENSLVHGLAGRDDGVVSVRARRVGDDIALALGDNGGGIAAEHLTRIYDPFFTTRLGSGGSGLGLYITHNIVTGVLGGRIDVDSAPGQGSRFTLSLPASAPR